MALRPRSRTSARLRRMPRAVRAATLALHRLPASGKRSCSLLPGPQPEQAAADPLSLPAISQYQPRISTS
jgi:hypothetical protein